MVSLMDRLLKLENLDLHLTPYKVLATGQDEGMLEFIPSRSLALVCCPFHMLKMQFLSSVIRNNLFAIFTLYDIRLFSFEIELQNRYCFSYVKGSGLQVVIWLCPLW